MYVCLCNGVSDKQIIEAVQKGATNMNMLSEKLSVATQCGKCRDYAEQLLEETKASLAPAAPQSTAPTLAQASCNQSEQSPT